MACFVELLRIILPLLAQNFESLNTIALLRSTCKEIYHDTTNFTLMYRNVLHNIGWVNKTLGKKNFVLNQQDMKEMEYINSSSLTFSELVIAGFPRGHLVESQALFEASLQKHGSVQGICVAYVKRQKRKEIYNAKKFLAREQQMRHSLEILIRAMETIIYH